MNTPQQQAELYRKAAETIEMCAEHGIEPMVKHNGNKPYIKHCTLNFNFSEYEFPLAVVEGKLVWEGDELYIDGEKFTVKYGNEIIKRFISRYSWNPPKRTVMVELTVDDAEYLAEPPKSYIEQNNRIIDACRKALGNLK